MDIRFTNASSLASIDYQIEDNRRDLSPSQYEIIRQVIYHTADFEYYSLLEFSEDALTSGFNALTGGLPIIVDVPAIQVTIVPKLQQTFHNPVYCCGTTGKEVDFSKTKAAFGLLSLAKDRPRSIFVIGQDGFASSTLVELIENEEIFPSLAIVTAPLSIAPDVREYLKSASVPTIHVNSPKGGATVASAIVNGLIDLAWRATINND
ncbi:precorrin-8X methylmutase [Waterburya agarophytonicola K14]|uniref:Precorrin-8X methylmutase n=1 Tax=Waterburya agarophytonicola KI4 TaxID=2874699 RepID=A0A964BQT1_9CYAN|nr:precorrin-8X methylmutase [Waterburya agarophytonicola]MCC0176105.1 precorrin-8X methylmutase [Waterburya agarophytonicola KI4]